MKKTRPRFRLLQPSEQSLMTWRSYFEYENDLRMLMIQAIMDGMDPEYFFTKMWRETPKQRKRK